MTQIKYQYEVLRTFALTYNYNQWIFNKLKPFIGKIILEVGCGIGNLTKYFTQYKKLTCIDNCLEFIKHMQIDFPQVEFYNYDITDTEVLKIKKNGFDTIICVNVLEHIKDDIQALKNMHNLLQSNGKLLLFVPALGMLYGSIDKKLGHFRRYSKSELIEKITKTRFVIEKIEYNNFLGLFGWFINSRIFKKERFPILQTIFFDKFIPVTASIEQKITIPIGMNLFVVVRKP